MSKEIVPTQPVGEGLGAFRPFQTLEQIGGGAGRDDLAARLSGVATFFHDVWQVIVAQVTTVVGLYQLVAILAAGLAAWLLRRLLLGASVAPLREKLCVWLPWRLRSSVAHSLWSLFWAMGLGLAGAAFAAFQLPHDFVRAARSLLLAVAIIRFLTALLGDAAVLRVLAGVIVAAAALDMVRLLTPLLVLLDDAALKVGTTRISLLLILKTGLIATLLMWMALGLSELLRQRLNRGTFMPATAQTLIIQAARIVLLLLAAVLALSFVGVDLTALAVLSGAIGVGLGFGLQGLFGNLVAGFTILLERSIRIGDYVELEGGLAGTVRALSFRATELVTNDNLAILVPNDQFIAKRVTNWTMRENQRRLHVPFVVAYGTPKERVRQAGLEAVAQVPFTLQDVPGREPQVWLVGFGESGLQFELVVWLTEAGTGNPGRVMADYYWALDDALSHHAIVRPLPQREVRLLGAMT